MSCKIDGWRERNCVDTLFRVMITGFAAQCVAVQGRYVYGGFTGLR